MKILHTSDWHLGHSLYGIDTIDDQIKILNEIARVCRDENPDLFLLAGDIFDTARPSMAVQKIFADTILRLRHDNPEMDIVIIAGNHDSASMHEIFARPWSDLNVNVLGEANPNHLEMAKRCVIVDNKCAVIAIPYFAERFMPDNYTSNVLSDVIDTLPPELPIVMMLHTTVDKCDYTGHDSDDTAYVGGIKGIPLDQLGSGYDYLALGHIHRPQNVSDRARYCGSPMMLSFDEAYIHSVSIIELSKRGETPHIKSIDLPQPRRLVTLPDNDKYAGWDEIDTLISEITSTDDYYRINLAHDQPRSQDNVTKARVALAQRGGALCCVNRQAVKIAERETEKFDIQSFKKLSPIEVAKRYLQSKDEMLSDQHAEMLQEIIDLVTANDRN